MDQTKIGLFIRELRKEKDLTQEQLAESLGVSNRSISRWENGVNMPDLSLVIEMAKLFDISIGELLDGEREEDIVDKKTEESLMKAAEYGNNEATSKDFAIYLLPDSLGINMFLQIRD